MKTASDIGSYEPNDSDCDASELLCAESEKQCSHNLLPVHDYDICVRYSAGKKEQSRSLIPHFSLIDADGSLGSDGKCSDGASSGAAFIAERDITALLLEALKNAGEDSFVYDKFESTCTVISSDSDGCFLLPCDMTSKYGENNNALADFEHGCTANDSNYFFNSAHFSVLALSLACKTLFPSLCLHDKLIINGLLTEICQRKPATLRAFLTEMNTALIHSILTILHQLPSDVSTTLRNQCDVVIREIEEHLNPSNPSSHDEESEIEADL